MIMPTSPDAVRQKISQLVKIGEVDDAARLAEAEGLLPEALELYQQVKDHRSRGRILEKLGQPEKALKVYEEGKLYEFAAQLAEKLGQKEKATKLYAQHWKSQPKFIR